MSEQRIPIVLKGVKGQVRVSALLDSGATLSVVSKAVADRIGMEDYGMNYGEDIQGNEVGGIHSVARVKIAGGWIASDFIIFPNVPDKVILGVDFIQKADLNINWKTEKVTIPNIYKRTKFRI
jgi:predicted aspartyl protease